MAAPPPPPPPNSRSPMRVLIRPPSSSTHHHHQPPPSLPPLPPPPPPPQPTQTHQNGVVVVGFIGRQKAHVGQLINRVIDTNVFGSGDADVAFVINDEIKDWFNEREISYYYDELKGVLYLGFCEIPNDNYDDGVLEFGSGFDSVFEKRDFGYLQGMFFMFSVCHVVIFMQEGSHFDIQILKKFRVLQGAKNAMFPFIKTQTLHPTTSRSHTSPSSRNSSGLKNRSPGKNGPPTSRNNSSATSMSGFSSNPSLFPGQYTPVILFVFIDDISDPGSNQDEPAESTSSNQSSASNSLKGSGSIVVLSRPATKSEGGFKKKLQSSLEAQIRFSLKKCRVLSGSETGPPGSRSGSVSNPAPLFSLDASKAVLIVDRKSNQMGESLEFATSIVENILNGISTSDSLLLESHSLSSNKEDILSIKEFISKQCDFFRGRGSMVSTASNVSAGGVGMVAVAAAAAAASVASGKPSATPELPSLDLWLTSSQTILYGLLCAKPGLISEPEPEQFKRRSRQRNNIAPAVEGSDPLELAATYLDSSRGLNTKFSILWCQRALPVAKDVYLSDLPTCYQTSQHEAHLVKALTSFKSMVKGPAVQDYLKKLEDECTSIWISGRQLCDAVSLTGRPCIHQRHESETDIKQHSSGFVFLHACACGRSRKLREDPFDFEAANVTFNCYPECDKLLPTLNLLKSNTTGPIQSSSWSLVRLGGSRYYQPSKGLLQSGFSSAEKFLLKWKFYLEKQKEPSCLPPSLAHGYSMNGSSNDSQVEAVSDVKLNKAGNGVETQSKANNVDESNSNSTRVLPSFTMKKQFSEVVAGSAATRSGFPPLQSKLKPSLGSVNATVVKTFDTNASQGSKEVENISSAHDTMDGIGNGNGNPFLQMANTGNVISKNGREHSSNQVVVYTGFEHECPRGHRFILTPEHLKGLGPIYALDEESHNSSVEILDYKGVDLSKMGKHGGHGKVNRHSNRMVRNQGRSKEVSANGSQGPDGILHLSRSRKEQNGVVKSDHVNNIEGSLQSTTLDDDGNCFFALINRNIPLYLNCPHCQVHKNKNDQPNVQFAGTTSQLQRIFLVTPSFPVVLATCPVIQFEVSCPLPSVPDREQKLQFSIGSPVVLPPESFVSLRLPFVYGVELEDGSVYPLKPFESQPELTAWITKGTSLQVLSKGSKLEVM
uniref:uncharacterized protein LOC122582494 n=1 Tax=Erigeron canadensis TaxID=72917 RepID=UPI001CB8D280|nr:uncharacterized protein LOC122582494 [Erigeron canadensis]XP_043610832.1 uncharacterized protein LOC122582494 [Erigeron canadensis]